MGLREKAVSGVAWSAAQNWGSRLINFVVFLVLARLLDPEAFGLVALAGVYIALIEVFVDQGFADAIIQRDDLLPGHLDTAFWTNLGLAVVFLLGSVAASEPIARLMNEPTLAPIISWLALSFVLVAFTGVQQALFERDLDYRTLAIREFFADTVGGATGIVMALYGYGVWSLVGYQLVRQTTAVIVLWTASDWRPGLQVAMQPFKDLFAFGVNIVGSNLLGFLNRRSDNLIIGYVLGPTALGFYDIAYRLLTVGTQLITQTVSKVAFSTFSRIQHDAPRLLNAFYSATRYISTIAFPVFLGAAVVAPELIQVAFGAQWVPSAPVFQVLSFIGILHALFYFNGAVLKAMGRPGWTLVLGVINAVVNVTAFVIVVQWGILAVALAYVVRGYLLAPLPLLLVRKLVGLGWREYLSGFTAPLISSAVMVGVVLLAKLLVGDVLALPVALGLFVLTGAVVYIGVHWLVEPERLLKLQRMAREAVPTSSKE